VYSRELQGSELSTWRKAGRGSREKQLFLVNQDRNEVRFVVLSSSLRFLATAESAVLGERGALGCWSRGKRRESRSDGGARFSSACRLPSTPFLLHHGVTFEPSPQRCHPASLLTTSSTSFPFSPSAFFVPPLFFSLSALAFSCFFFKAAA
jgi:hypothetical protein